MKRLVVLLVIGALVATGMTSGAIAGITENFNYPNGNLTTVSGAAWQLWAPGAGDATVTGGVAGINPPTDVARLFPNELQAIGSVVNFSFDVRVTTAGSVAGDYQVFFSPATLPLSTGQDYPNSLGFSFDWGNAGAGLSNVGVWAGGTGGPVTVATMTAGAFHTISGTMTKNAATISYTLLVDGVPVSAGNSAHTNPLGINCFEMYNQLGTGVTGGFELDNLVLTPEPSTMSLLAIAGLIAIRRRRS